VLARCLDYPDELGPQGVDVILQAGALTQPLRTDAVIPRLSQSQGDFLARLPETAVAELTAQAPDVARVAALTRLTLSQSEVLRQEIARLQVVARDRAILQAKSRLECVHISGRAQVWCPDGALKSSEIPQLIDGRIVVNPGVAEAGEVVDARSFAAAQQGAQRLADKRRICYYGNAEVIVSCRGDLGFAEEIPTDTEDIPLLGERRVGTYTIPANTIYSRLSQADADTRARAEALANLNCFYVNAELVLSCGDADDLPGQGPPGRWDGVVITSPTEPADATLGEVGNPVMVPAGALKSTTSAADVAQQARITALGALECYWRSVEVTATCPDYGTGVGALRASTRSPVRTVTLPAGVETSALSQAAADASALSFAQAQLQCLYCNVEIPPLCVPAYVFERPDYRLPIPREWVDASWSVDATQGVAADTYCSEDPTQAPGVAGVVATTQLVTLPTGCRYENSAFRVGCVASAVDNILGPFTEPDRARLSRNSYPDPMATAVAARSILIAAGAFAVYVASEADVPADVLPGSALNIRAQAYVNQLARQTALSYLTCYFESDPLTVACADVGHAGAAATLSNSPITAETGYVVSYTSKQDANTRARAALLQQLSCVYASPEMVLRCFVGVNSGGATPPAAGVELGTRRPVYGDGRADVRATGVEDGLVDPTAVGSTTRPLLLPFGYVTSRISQQDATTRALAQGVLGLDCYWTNPEMTVACGATLDMVEVGSTLYPPPLAAPAGAFSPDAVTSTVIPAGAAVSYDGALGAMRAAFRQAFGLLLCLPPDPNDDTFGALCGSMRRARWSASNGNDLRGTGTNEAPFATIDKAAESGFRAFEDDLGTITYHKIEGGKKVLKICQQGDAPDVGGEGGGGVDGSSPGLPGPPGPSSGCNGDCHAFYA
jgi:hypothetical protein